MEFAYDSGGLAKGGAVTLYLDGSWVQLDQGVDDHDHLIRPEERLHKVISWQ